MHTSTKWLLAAGLMSAASLAIPTAASAQGFYLGVPGFGIGVGAPWYGGYYGYGEPYGYDGYYGYYGRPYGGHHYHHYYRR